MRLDEGPRLDPESQLGRKFVIVELGGVLP